MILKIDNDLRIELINENHISSIFDMVDMNRTHLRQWLPFVDSMQTIAFADNFVKGTMKRNIERSEYAFVIIENEITIGRIGVYKIDTQNKIGEIGYWIVEDAQGKGIVSKSCKAVIDFCFSVLELNRIEIKCGIENLKSRTIPERLNFKHEGIIRQGELLYGNFIDLNLYSLLKADIM
ncbi:GNAT family N-acetyltransferase [Flavobacterium luteum]|uniref:GNAT family N-acetyltransferase n=1 Tax=Flavobacterium luteum TaxID=2026654 RepID=A0A7J5AJW9_9FLAO|nr:GNAT family protein [Flavobacterium luteum]KAB1157780.1 GNAT family N-acetyltransferase [Flavobacterium luteum]